MKKLIIFSIIVYTLIFNVSCKDKNTTINNNVINQEVSIEDKITISSIEDALVNASELVSASVVGVKAIGNNSLINNPSTGSGVIISKKDNTYYIVTNRHVICKSKSVIYDDITIFIGSLNVTIPASLVCYDENIDLALLKIETTILLKVATLGDSSTLKVGKYAICIGCPYQMENYYNSVTIGHISFKERMIQENSFINQEISNKYIQHDAAINVGSSGGGLFNINGELVGINTLKITGSSNIDGMSFAIPVNSVKEVFKNYLS